MSAAVETARKCLCGNALQWTACCDLPVCTDCHPGPWASAADGSGEFGHIGPCPGHNMAGYPLTPDLATQLATAINERDRARATAVALEQNHAHLLRDLRDLHVVLAAACPGGAALLDALIVGAL